MSSLVDRQRSGADRAGLGAYAAGRAAEGDAPLGIQLDVSHVVAGPSVGRHGESGGRARGRAGHGGTGNTGLDFGIDVGSAGGESAIGGHLDDRMGRTDVDASAAASA